MNVEEWKVEIRRRAAQWTAEYKQATDQREAEARARQAGRAAEWPAERIRAAMTAARRAVA